ncbi:MAG: hypothetical protein WC340_10150 [Kiritimatiellia bacterium]
MKLKMILSCTLFVAALVWAGQPLPPAVIYGQIRDEYGHPMDSGAEVVIYPQSGPIDVITLGGVSQLLPDYGRYVLDGPIYVGMNYRISIALEDAYPLQNPKAAQPGDLARVAVLIDGLEQPLVPSGALTIPEPGGVLRLDFSVAQDMDNDGLPDAWENLMVAWSEGLFNTIYDINPNDDFDGDGMSNYNEYLAGTLPFLATDIFKITRSQPDAATGRIALSFSTIAGRKYHILVSGSLAGGNWNQAAAATTAVSPFEYQVFDGTGREITVYVDGSIPAAFFRIGAN